MIPQRLAVCAEAGGGEREDAIKTTGRLLKGCGLLCGYLGGGEMPAGMMVMAGFVVAGIIATALVWHELDRVERARRRR